MGEGPHNGKFSIVHHGVLDDEKFEKVYDDDHLFAGWLRLLIAADKTWPAPAPIPRDTHDDVLDKLAEVGLIDLLPHGQFLMHGAEAERKRRRDAVQGRSEHAKRAAWARWHPDEPYPNDARA